MKTYTTRSFKTLASTEVENKPSRYFKLSELEQIASGINIDEKKLENSIRMGCSTRQKMLQYTLIREGLIPKTLFVYNNANGDRSSINNLACAEDNAGSWHSNQYKKPEGGLYSYEGLINYLTERFNYDIVIEVFTNKIVKS
jgi:hypothetical protein